MFEASKSNNPKDIIGHKLDKVLAMTQLVHKQLTEEREPVGCDEALIDFLLGNSKYETVEKE